MPADINPNFETTDERCGYGQSGPVFFLPIGVEGATLSPCVVAEGTAIYVIVSAIQCSNVEEPPFFGADEDGLRACVDAHPASAPSTSFHANVNGQEVADLDAYRIVTPLFTLTLGEDNDLGVEPGVAQAMALDYGFIIAPPPPGEYAIDVSTTIEGQPGVEYSVNVTVEAPQIIEPSGGEDESTATSGSVAAPEDSVTTEPNPSESAAAAPASVAASSLEGQWSTGPVPIGQIRETLLEAGVTEELVDEWVVEVGSPSEFTFDLEFHDEDRFEFYLATPGSPRE